MRTFSLLLIFFLSLCAISCVRSIETERQRYFLITLGFSVLFVSDKEMVVESQVSDIPITTEE